MGSLSNNRFVLVAAAAAGIVLAGARAGLAASDVDAVKKSGKLVILTDLSDPDDPTKLFFKSKSGYDGIEYQILESFARTLGCKVEARVAPFADLFPAIEEHRGDVWSASITATPKRAARLDLSESYFPFRQTVVTKASSTARSFADLAGKTAITQRDTTWETECRKVPRVKLTYTEHQRDLFARVADGSADFSVTDSPLTMSYFEVFPGLRIAFALPEEFNFVFALRKGSDLTPLLDAHIRNMRKTGAYYALLGRYYGPKGLSIIKTSGLPDPSAPGAKK